MKYSLCTAKHVENNREEEMINYKEQIFRREFETAIKRGHLCSAPKKSKRFRSAFTTEQVNHLEKEFRKYPYIGNSRRKDVASILNIPERAVKIWFQNRRMKEKKDVNKDSDVDFKAMNVVNDQLSDMIALPSTNYHSLSLPLIKLSEESKKLNKTNKILTKDDQRSTIVINPIVENHIKDVSRNRDLTVKKVVNRISSSTDLKNYPEIGSNSSPEFSIEIVKKNETENSEAQIIVEHTVPKQKSKQSSHLNKVIPKTGHEKSRFASYKPSSAIPQDLLTCDRSGVRSQFSAKPNSTQVHQINPEVTASQSDVPLYLKEFHTHPYFAARNLVWKPLNVSPILSTGVSSMQFSNDSGLSVTSQERNDLRKCCNCDCHTYASVPYNAPMIFHQNDPNPHRQYVITAVPFQNS